ncbi:FMN-binding protein [Sansalvadorimonas verongulae]|uniref:FMN-binding protein n=1 Tax=Sansalvadorimonas verongulae TaxID=2172824 RepID=UPI0012BC7E21|nr:FMN-binding protein [Sansalvadorimonas verongulae]MTI13978.1 FMN-binding protein [Sansalvadorimonas verongulae]
MSCKDCSTPCASRQAPQPLHWRLDIGKIFRLLAVISLVAAYFVGQSLNQPSWIENIQAVYPKADITPSDHLDNTWEIHKDGEPVLLMSIATENGYGGPMTVGTVITQDGMVKAVKILAHSDTPAYIQRLSNNFFYRQFENQPVDRSFEAGKNFDVISGATISSNGIMKAHAAAAHYIARAEFGKHPVELKDDIRLSTSHYIMAALILLVLINIRLKNTTLKVAVILASLAVIGFMANQMINVANFSALFLGFLPTLAGNPGFWLLGGAVFAGIIVLGRNIYCGNLCPFYAVQFVLSKISGLNLPLHPLIKRYAANLSKIGLWAGLMVGFLTTTPTAGSYEPFSMIFSLQGEGIQWYIMPAVVLACFFVPNLFCRFLCPAGEALTRITVARNTLVHAIKGARK